MISRTSRAMAAILCAWAALSAPSPALAQAQTEPDAEYSPPAKSSGTFDSSYANTITALSARNFDADLQSPGMGSVESTEFSDILKKIKLERPIKVGLGKGLVDYDIILQPGHYDRKVGKVGTSGKLVSERALVAYITGGIAEALRARGLNVLVVSADEYHLPTRNAVAYDGLKSKLFLSIHADGSTSACTSGPSLGYTKGTSPMAMHAIGWALAQSLGYTYEEFRKDNFTADEAHYYMFGVVRAPTLTGLLEIGELTCADKEKRLVASADAIAANIARALEFLATTGSAPTTLSRP